MKFLLTIILVVISSKDLFSQEGQFNLSNDEISKLKESYNDSKKDIQYRENLIETKERELNEKYQSFLETFKKRDRLESALEEVKKLPLKKKGDVEKAFENLASCMIETLKGSKVRYEPNYRQVLVAMSPWECYRYDESSRNFFEYEIKESAKRKKVHPLTTLILENSETFFGPDKLNQISGADKAYQKLKRERVLLYDEKNKFQKLEIKYNSVIKFEKNIEELKKCQSESSIVNNRFTEIQSKKDSEIASMEDLLYSNSKCRKSLVKKDITGQSFCERFNFYITSMDCISESSEFADLNLVCPEENNLFNNFNLKKAVCHKMTTDTPFCSDNNFSSQFKNRFECKSSAPHLAKELTSLEEARIKAREVIGENILRGQPTITTNENNYLAIIGIKPNGKDCNYLIRDYTTQTEKWLDENDVLTFSKEFNFLRR